MDQGTLVVEQIDDGRRFIEQFVADGNSVSAAFWLKAAEEETTFLFLATDIVDRDGPAAAYRNVRVSFGKLGNSWISSSEIKVISPNSPIAKDVLKVMTLFPGPLPIHFHGKVLGGVEVENGYIYPAQFLANSNANPVTAN